jgi:transforming growth factor-beta-induced protein
MKTQYRLFSILLLASLVLSACAAAAVEPEPMPTTAPTQAPLPTATPMPEPEVLDIVDTAVADGRFTTLAAALGAADLVDTLKGEGPFTVFAPTDEAFAQLPEGTVEALLEDIPQLTDILLYHVVPGKVMAADVVMLDGQEAATALEGKNIAISIVDGKVFLNESVEVIITDIDASNGVIHVIDSVLLPPADEAAAEEEMAPEMDIVDTAVADGRFTTLAAALGAADLVDTLKGEGPFTVFAPTDEAFAQLPEGTVEALLEDIPQLTDILLYHVVPGKVMAADVVGLDGQEAATALEGKNIAISIVDGKVFLNESVEVIITDIDASNGVIHVIDSVLLPPADEAAAEMDIVDTAVADGRFTTLAAALGAADLVDTLKGEGPFTVFAPTDEAFAQLPEGTVEALLEDIPQLTDILLYHVVPGKVMAADVVMLDGQEAATALEGKNIAISIVDGKVFLNESVEVIITDIETTNGVIHVIDAVLLPPQ